MNTSSEDKTVLKALLGLFGVVIVTIIFMLVATGVVRPFGATGTAVDPAAPGDHGHMHY